MIKSKNLFFTDSLRNVETTDETSSTFWIVAFFISLLINIVFVSAILISRRYEIKYFFFTQTSKEKQRLFVFWFLFQKCNFLNIRSCHLGIYLFLVGKQSLNRNQKRIRLIFLVDLGLSQNRQLQLMTHLTIKISVCQKMKTPTKLYINNDSNWLNPCHQ